MRTLLLVVFGVRPDSEVATVLEDSYRRMGPDGHVAPVGPEQTAAFHAIRKVVLQILQSMRADDAAQFGDSVMQSCADGPEP